MPERRRALPVVLGVVLAAALFGTLGPVSRWAFAAGMEPLAFVTWRAVVGAIVLVAFLAIVVARGHRLVDVARLPRAQQLGLVAGAFGVFAVNLAIFLAFDRIAVALALLGFYLYPALVALATSVLGWEPLDRWRVSALVLAFAGVVLILLGQLDPTSSLRLDPLGVLFALAAACFQVVYILAGRRGYRDVPTEEALTILTVAATAGYLLLVLALGRIDAVLLPFRELSLWPIVLYAGVAGAALPAFLFLTGVRTIGGTRTAILAMVEPVVGVILAALLLGETLGPVQIVGGGMVITAGILLQRGHPDPAAQPADVSEPSLGASG